LFQGKSEEQNSIVSRSGFLRLGLGNPGRRAPPHPVDRHIVGGRATRLGSDDPSETESYSEYSELVDDDYY